ncbi:MAG: ABC transporter permease, partial [Gemmatimonadota bacterium]
MNRLVHDIEVAVRGFRRAPAFAATVVLILGLGIGMTVAMLTVSDAVLWRRLPVRDQDRVVVLWGVGEGAQTQLQLRLPQYERFRAASRTLSEAAAVPHWGVIPYPMADGDRNLSLRHALVTGNFFQTLGSTTALGRPLQPADDVVGAEPVMVISHNVWTQQFAGDPNIIGRRLTMRGFRGLTYTIVGVARAGLDYPVGTDVWAPVVPFTTIAGQSYVTVFVVGRLAPDASPAMARAELFNFLRRADEASSNLAVPVGAAAQTLSEAVLGNVRPALLVLTSAALLLLLAACLNVGNLLLLRAHGHTREIGIRRALGAGYGDIAKHVLLESTLLAAGGGLLGLLVALGLLRALFVMPPADLPRLDMIRLGGAPVTVAALVTVVAVLLFGLGPAIAAARIDPAALLRVSSGSRGQSGRRSGLRHALVGAQIALAFVVLAGAGLLTRSLARLQRLDLGFSSDGVSLIQISLPSRLGGNQREVLALHEQVVAKFRAVPGVSGATPLFMPPFVGEGFNVDI